MADRAQRLVSFNREYAVLLGRHGKAVKAEGLVSTNVSTEKHDI